MGRWAFMLGGLIVWAVHFVGVYGIVSIGDVVDRADAPAWRLAALAFTGACLAALAAHLIAAIRRMRTRDQGAASLRFMTEVAILGSALAAVAVLWQAIPAVSRG